MSNSKGWGDDDDVCLHDNAIQETSPSKLPDTKSNKKGADSKHAPVPIKPGATFKSCTSASTSKHQGTSISRTQDVTTSNAGSEGFPMPATSSSSSSAASPPQAVKFTVTVEGQEMPKQRKQPLLSTQPLTQAEKDNLIRQHGIDNAVPCSSLGSRLINEHFPAQKKTTTRIGKAAAKESSGTIDLVDGDSDDPEALFNLHSSICNVPSSNHHKAESKHTSRPEHDEPPFVFKTQLSSYSEKNEHRPIELRDVFLGKRRFRAPVGTKNTMELSVFENTLHFVLFEGDSDAFGRQQPERAYCLGHVEEDISLDDIVKIAGSPVNDCNKLDYFIAIDISGSTVLNSVAVGNACTLNPTLYVNEPSNPSKYILLIMDHSNYESAVALFSKYAKIKFDQYPPKEDIYKYTMAKDHPMGEEAMLRLRLKAKEEIKKARKRAKKRRGNEVDPADQEVYLVYPPDEDAYDPITIYKGNLKRIEPEDPDFLSDNLIDLMIRHHINELPIEKQNKIHAFSCLFYTKLCEEKESESAHAMVARWTKNVNLFEKDFILVPVNLDYHWSLTVIVRPGLFLERPENDVMSHSALIELDDDDDDDVKVLLKKSEDASKKLEDTDGNLPCFLFMDSLSMHNSNNITKKLRAYLNHEFDAINKRRMAQAKQIAQSQSASSASSCASSSSFSSSSSSTSSDAMMVANDAVVGGVNDESAASLVIPLLKLAVDKISSANMPVRKPKMPEQLNGYDCGVYVERYASYLMEKWPTSTAQDQNGKNVFSKFFSPTHFNDEGMKDERQKILNLLEEISVKWRDIRKEVEERKLKEKQAKRARVMVTHPEADLVDVQMNETEHSSSSAAECKEATDERDDMVDDDLSPHEATRDSNAGELNGIDDQTDVDDSDMDVDEKADDGVDNSLPVHAGEDNACTESEGESEQHMEAVADVLEEENEKGGEKEEDVPMVIVPEPVNNEEARPSRPDTKKIPLQNAFPKRK